MDSEKEEPQNVGANTQKRKRTFPARRQGKGSKLKREDAYRKANNPAAAKEVQADIARIIGGSLSDDDLGIKITDNAQPLSAELEVSTRGLGINLSQMYCAINAQYPDKIRNLCSPAESYRTTLVQAAVRIRATESIPSPDVDGLREPPPYVVHEISDAIRSHESNFSMVALAIEGLATTELQGKTFRPKISDTTDPDGNFLPDPFKVTMHNYRNTLDAMRNGAGTPRPIRRRFHENNPIPGAVFDNNHWIVNHDDLIVQNWPSALTVSRDAVRHSSLMAFLRSKPKGRGLVSSFNYDAKGNGTIVPFCNPADAIGYRVIMTEAGLAVLLTGRQQWLSQHLVTDQLLLRAAISMLGETPEWSPCPGRFRETAIRTMDVSLQHQLSAHVNHCLK